MENAVKDDVMQDLETLGTAPGCSIISIGAVAFDKNGLGSDFYVEISRQSCLDNGLKEDPNTLAWWSKQSLEAQKVLVDAEHKKPLTEALSMFSEWFGSLYVGRKNTVKLWGNGSDFDNVLLAAAYRAVNMTPPWGNFNGRCYRTLKSLYPHVKLERSGTHHNALHDAITQARHAVAILQAGNL